jgi:hypothetical protein
MALGYLPLAIHEVTNQFSEIRGLVDYLASGGPGPAAAGLAERVVMVVVRSLTWPVAGLVTDRPAASVGALAVIITLGAAGVLLRARRRPGGPSDDRQPTSAPRAAGLPDRWAAGWLLGTLAFSVVALAVLAPSLAVVVPGLPNDHYHAFLDPVVLALVGAGAAGLARATQAATAAARVAGPALSLALAGALVAVAVTAWPPAVSPDGGWRLADAAAAHIVEVVEAGWPTEEPKLLASLPAFKPDDAMRFPLERRGLRLEPAIPARASPGGLDVGVVTLVCDPLFDAATGVGCGGPAEERWLADAYPPGTMQLVERFRAGDRRILSIYGPSRLAASPGAAR